MASGPQLSAAPAARSAPRPPIASATRRRRLIALAVLFAVLVACCFASVAVGAKEIGLGDVWKAFAAYTNTENDIVIMSLRLPRTGIGVLAGAALGLAGALIQGHTRNPLADPGLLGVNAGAALVVVIGIYVFGVTSLIGYVWFAFAGALAASVAVFVLGSMGRGGPTPVTLALAGAAVTAMLSAFTSAIILVDVQTLDAYRFWAVGALAGRDASVAGQVVWFIVLGMVIAFASAPALNALALGDDVATSLGHSVRRTHVAGVIAITLLAGSATAACGPIAFVGLVVPHLARTFTGPDFRWLLPVSALVGAILLLVADIVGRVVVRPSELQVGIVLALVGGPFFVWLVRRRKMVQV
jgi:iron complex transport system permease protein